MHIRSTLLVPFASAAIYSCSSSEPKPADAPSGYEDVLIKGDITESALAAFVQALENGTPADVASLSATLDWPADGEKLPHEPPSSFCWHFGPVAQRERHPRHPPNERWTSLQLFDAQPPTGLASPLRELFGPPRRAIAQGEPYSGPATYLVFSTDAEPNFLRVLTSDVAFAPSKEVWDAMAATGKPITLKLISGLMEQDRIPADERLVAGTSIEFTVSQ